jgi:hypothetical protein
MTDAAQARIEALREAKEIAESEINMEWGGGDGMNYVAQRIAERIEALITDCEK